ncbi:hypothetical protein HOLleu_16425 [Holothuria leucospilota]|uniref:Uncharacterized protein n=1 Tax=Holothuria leucospilota TaxID=206669 RepID=A0A9Q1C637_HOLLE|nr:hypothetical protein HOLleu_16425 [Holothuria leucospilota]
MLLVYLKQDQERKRETMTPKNYGNQRRKFFHDAIDSGINPTRAMCEMAQDEYPVLQERVWSNIKDFVIAEHPGDIILEGRGFVTEEDLLLRQAKLVSYLHVKAASSKLQRM